MSQANAGFDPEKFKAAARTQWNSSGAGYSAWGGAMLAAMQPAVARMMDLAGISVGSRVLELAAGSGELTMQLAARVGPQGRVLATDLAPGILSFAAEKARAAGFNHVETREMDGEQVDVPAESFDVAVSSLGLMHFPNPAKSVEAQRRALRSGGKVGALVISSPERNPFFSIPARVIREKANLPVPQPGRPGPFALGAPGVVEALFAKAGLRDVAGEKVAGRVELPSVAEHVQFLKDAFGGLHMMMSGMSEPEKEAAWDLVGEALASFQGADGFRCPGEFIVCVGTK